MSPKNRASSNGRSRDAKVTYRVEFRSSPMARRTAATDYSCICMNIPSNRNGAAKRKSDLAGWFTLAFLHEELLDEGPAAQTVDGLEFFQDLPALAALNR
jgi:hypothetical protein